MHTIYVLKSKKDKKLYTGYSKDVEVRLAEHNAGKVSATRKRKPLELIFCELFKNRQDAVNRERFLKTGWGRNQLYKILENTLNA